MALFQMLHAPLLPAPAPTRRTIAIVLQAAAPHEMIFITRNTFGLATMIEAKLRQKLIALFSIHVRAWANHDRFVFLHRIANQFI